MTRTRRRVGRPLLLGVTGLGARQIMGYTTAVMLIVFPIYLACICLL